MLSSSKGEKHARAAPEAPSESVKVVENLLHNPSPLNQ
jgi:hypothetical protein